MKANQIARIYRNPIYLARKYKQMIDNGQVKKQSGLARKLGLSRVRIHQMLSLPKLNPLIIQELEKLGDPLKLNIISERMLQPYVNKPDNNKKLFSISKKLFLNIENEKIL